MKNLFLGSILFLVSISVYAEPLPVVHLKPQVKILPIPGINQTISIKEIGPFLNQSRVIDNDEWHQLPRIVGNSTKRVLAAEGDEIYVEKIKNFVIREYIVVKPMEPYFEPKTKKILGYPVRYKGKAALEKKGPIATFKIIHSTEEIAQGDLLMPALDYQPASIQPKIPQTKIDGQIIDVLGSVSQIGKFNIVAMNRGQKNGIEIGDQFLVYQLQALSTPSYGTLGKTLPKLNVGKIMVFKTFQQVSFALVTSATQSIHINDLFESEQRDER